MSAVRVFVSRHGTAAGVAVAGLVLVLLSGAIAMGLVGSPAGGRQPSASPTTSAGGSPYAFGLPAPSAPPSGDWTRAQLAPLPVLADLTPSSGNAGGIATDTTFTLTSRTDSGAAELADRLTVEPYVPLARAPSADGKSLTLRPERPLVRGAVYRFTLTARDGTTGGSWAFQAKQPLQIVTTLPGNHDTDVPTNTGIEVVFDQDGVEKADQFFAIQPRVAGRFEQHGRTLAFVPSARLKAKTIYMVTIRRGVPLAGSDQRLEDDIKFQFETQGGTVANDRRRVELGRPLLETSTREPASIGVMIPQDEGRAPTAVQVSVYRLASMRTAIDDLRSILTAPSWARYNRLRPIDTKALPRVMSFRASLQRLDLGDDVQWFRFPERLQAGWYVIDLPDGGQASQAVLQATDIATYLLSTSTDTLVWVNDVASGKPIRGAPVSLDAGAALGETDAQGLLRIHSPDAVRAAQDEASSGPPVFVVRDGAGRSAFAALHVPTLASYQPEVDAQTVDLYGIGADGATDYWRLLYTDRDLYRATDKVHVWGFVRDRDSGKPPSVLELRLVAAENEKGPPISSRDVRPTPSGSFALTLPLASVPHAVYRIEVRDGPRLVASTYFRVGVITKPAYQLELSTRPRAVIRGQRVDVDLSARFFEGTPVPRALMEVSGFDQSVRVTTGSDGRATARLTAQTVSAEGWDTSSVQVSTAGGEEAEIGGETLVAVFPSAAWLETEGGLTGGQLTVRGSALRVDLADFARQFASNPYGDLKPHGQALANLSLDARIVELVPVRSRVGSTYDFIEKRVIELYDYRTQELQIARRTIRTGSDGRFNLAMPTASNNFHRIEIRARDANGRQALRTIEVGPTTPESLDSANRSFIESHATGCDGSGLECYAVGDAVRLTMRDNDGPLPSGEANRYLFVRAHRGLRDAYVSASPELTTRFEASDVPNVTFVGVRFTGRGYVPAGTYYAGIRPETRAIDVELVPNARRYRPGETVTVDIRTKTRSGSAVPATVTVRTVDEKLYAIGGAFEINPLRALYEQVTNGLIGSYTSHQFPFPSRGGEGGDTAGGGGDEREDFQDALAFEQIRTDANGRGRISFKLSDDLTSWRFSAAAVTDDLGAGAASVLLPAALPFFVQETIAAEYLVGDRPHVRLRGFGSDLKAADRVTFVVESTSLGLAQTVRARAFEPVDVALPRLTTGEHRLTITATSGTGNGAHRDVLTRRFRVVASRHQHTEASFAVLSDQFRATGAEGFTSYVFTEAGRGRLVPLLQRLAEAQGPRVDRALAADVARELLVTEFGWSESDVPPRSFDGRRYQRADGQVGLVGYAGGDLRLTVDVALMAAAKFDGRALRSAFLAVRDNAKATRERKLMALAGLAALGDPVLSQIRAARAIPDLTVRERLYLALAADAGGDDPSAVEIERALLSEFGETLGPWARLRTGKTDEDTVEATALAALVAAGVGDPLATPLQAYVDANPPRETLAALEQVGFAVRMLPRLAVATAKFAYSVDGNRTVIDLGGRDSFSMALTRTQAGTLRLERLTGDVAVATFSHVASPITTQKRDSGVTIARTVRPSGALRDDRALEVTLTVRLGPQTVRGCYEVIDLAPSGFIPISRLERLAAAYDEGEKPPNYILPSAIEGQRVQFCVVRDPKRPTATLRYFARPISPGTYVWEPALAQSVQAPNSLSYTGSGRITIVAAGR